MRCPLIILISWICLGSVMSQSVAGITGIRDTSYNVQNELQKNRKKYPSIALVPLQESSSVIERRNVTYCKIGERQLVLDAFYPAKKTKTKKTAVIIIHGGGWRSGDKSLHHPLAQHLAALGYVCFTPEYRLSTEALFPAAVYDLKAAIRWIRENANTFNIDTAKLVALGHSAGGELAAFLGATNGNVTFEGNDGRKGYSSRVNAVVDIDGTLAFIHPESGEGDDSKGTSAATYWFGYSKTENPALWKQAAPLTHVGQSTPPTLFLNSMVERMHAGRDDFNKVLDQFEIYHAVKTYEGAPHSFCLFEPWFTPMVADIDQFIKKVLPAKKGNDRD